MSNVIDAPSAASVERAHRGMFVKHSFIDMFDVTIKCGSNTKKGGKCGLNVSITRPGHRCGLHSK